MMIWEEEFHIESWILYGFGMIISLARLTLRIYNYGFRKLKWDDWGMVFAMCCYTTIFTFENLVISRLIHYREDAAHGIMPQYSDLEKNSKMVICAEQFMETMLYTLKGCVLAVYSRLGAALKEDLRRPFILVSVYVVLCFLGTIVAFWTFCIPGYEYWNPMTTNKQCKLGLHYAILQTVLNISSDIFIMALSIPVLLRTSLPWRQKLILYMFYSLGLFLIAAAACTKAFSFSHPGSLHFFSWYIREAATAVVIANLPVLLPMVRRMIIEDEKYMVVIT